MAVYVVMRHVGDITVPLYVFATLAEAELAVLGFKGAGSLYIMSAFLPRSIQI